MRRSLIGSALLISGIALVILDAAAWIAIAVTPTVALAQPLPPRPTPKPTVTPPRERHATPTPQPSGRITGTVLDQATGAPAPGVAVMVGDATVVTDANGNYDRQGLPAGSYHVALMLAPGQGTPAQEPIAVDLAAGATVVQHLWFNSQPVASQPSAQPVPHALPRTGRAWDWAWTALLLGAAMMTVGAWLHRLGTRRG